jgi:hypothetical protein
LTHQQQSNQKQQRQKHPPTDPSILCLPCTTLLSPPWISVPSPEKHSEKFIGGHLILIKLVIGAGVTVLSSKSLLCVRNSRLLFTKTIVRRAFTIVRENLVSVRKSLESFGRARMMTAIGMDEFGESTIGLFDCVGSAGFVDAENVVERSRAKNLCADLVGHWRR